MLNYIILLAAFFAAEQSLQAPIVKTSIELTLPQGAIDGAALLTNNISKGVFYKDFAISLKDHLSANSNETLKEQIERSGDELTIPLIIQRTYVVFFIPEIKKVINLYLAAKEFFLMDGIYYTSDLIDKSLEEFFQEYTDLFHLFSQQHKQTLFEIIAQAKEKMQTLHQVYPKK